MRSSVKSQYQLCLFLMTCNVQIICDRVKINLNYNISLPNNVDKYNFFISDYNNNIEYI